MKSSTYFHMKTTVLADFQICISVPLRIFGFLKVRSDSQKTEAVVQRFSAKKVFLKISGNSQENTCARVPFLIKFIKKETLAHVFSFEFCEISKDTFFYRTHLVAASEKNIS